MPRQLNAAPRLTRHHSFSLTESERLRFWKKVHKTENCWLWTGCANKGYGQFNLSQPRHRLVAAHRISYFLSHGPLPENYFVCHKCDVRNCVNPAHLFLGLQKDNIEDMCRKGRSILGRRRTPEQLENGARGERNGHAKLTAAIVASLRERYAAGCSQAALAKELNIVQSTVSRAISGKRWSHLHQNTSNN